MASPRHTHTDKHKQVIPVKSLPPCRWGRESRNALGLDLRLCADKDWFPACAGMTVNTSRLLKYECSEVGSATVPTRIKRARWPALLLSGKRIIWHEIICLKPLVLLLQDDPKAKRS